MDTSDADGEGATSERAADEALRWETVGGATAFECPGFDVRRDDVRLPDGTLTDYHYVVESPAVVVLPFTPDGDVVTVAEWRQAVGRVNRGLPAGSVESDDPDFAAAARRELAEETGYEAGTMDHVATVEPANGIADSVHHHFTAHDCEPSTDPDLDDDESIRPVVRSYDDLLAAAVDGDLRDGRAVTALLRHELTAR